jgi:radical SAM superfamily enzyme YgiQ (UPF0313 family)
MDVLLLATYELGRQPFGLASPSAWLRQAGFDVACTDLSRDNLDRRLVEQARLIAIHLPMHTATRLALPVLDRLRAINHDAHLCAYGLYGPPNAALLRRHGVTTILGPEFESDLLALACRLDARSEPSAAAPPSAMATLPKLAFKVPDRTGLPAVSRYARVTLPSGEQRATGYTEASRGCKHRCRHCPVVPVYDGRFRIVPVPVVLADIANQVEAGATHITFGDPDFFNGRTHAVRVIEGLASAHPGVTYDVTIKIEHLLRYRDDLARLRDTGCLFVTSAVESIDDGVLARLEKGHTFDDFVRVVSLMRDVRLALLPTFVAFTPWTTLEGYRQLLRTLARLDLVDAVAPIQLALRLLIPAGSRLLELPEVRRLLGPWDEARLVHPWRHPDPGVDALQRDILSLIGRTPNAARCEVFDAAWALAVESPEGDVPLPAREPRPDRVTVPYLTEPWYC